MKRLIPVLSLVGLLAMSSCGFFWEQIYGNGQVVTRDVVINDFDAVRLEGIGRVVLSQESAASLTVIGESNILDFITTEVHGATLVIAVEDGVNLQPTEEPLFLVSSQGYDNITITGSGDVVCEGRLTGDDLAVAIEGSGDIVMDLDYVTLETVIDGSGDFNYSGVVDTQSVVIMGSGDVDAFALNSKEASVTIMGSGYVHLTVSESLNAAIYGSGDVVYQGHPVIQMQNYGSGEIRSR